MTATANPFTNKRTTTPPPQQEAPKQETPKADTFSSAPGQDKGADPFSVGSGPGSGDKITDFEGYLLLVKPTELIKDMATKSGVTDAVRADVVVLDHEDGTYESEGCLVFQQILRRDLMRTMEGPTTMLLGRLGKAKASPGKSAAFIFELPSDEDKDLARKYLQGKK